MYRRAQNYEFPGDIMEELLDYMYVQLIIEYLSSRSNPEHLSPVINRMSGLKKTSAKFSILRPAEPSGQKQTLLF